MRAKENKALCLHLLISGSEWQTLVWGPRLDCEKACLTTDVLLRQAHDSCQSSKPCGTHVQWMLREEPPAACLWPLSCFPFSVRRSQKDVASHMEVLGFFDILHLF